MLSWEKTNKPQSFKLTEIKTGIKQGWERRESKGKGGRGKRENGEGEG